MTPKLLRDVEALCDAVAEGDSFDRDGYADCRYCSANETGKAGEVLHKPDCPVMLAKRIREEMKADGV